MSFESLLRRFWTPSDFGPIGVEFGATEAAFVQFGRPKQGDTLPRLAAAVTAPYPRERDELLRSPEELRRFVQDALRDRRFSGNQVVTALRDDQVRLRVLSYEVAAGQSEPAVVLERVKEQLGLNLQEVIVDFVPIRTDGGAEASEDEAKERSALVVVAQRREVIEHLEQLAHAGLEADALEIAPLAVRRLLGWFDHEAVGDSTIVVECRAATSHLLVYWGRRLILYRSIDFARDDVTARISKSLEMSGSEAERTLAEFGLSVSATSAEAEPDRARVASSVTRIAEVPIARLVEQIELAAEYTLSRTRGSRVSQIRLIGDSDRWRGLTAVLAERSGMPVAWLDPAATLRGDAGTPAAAATSSSGALTLAMGYALRGFEARE